MQDHKPKGMINDQASFEFTKAREESKDQADKYFKNQVSRINDFCAHVQRLKKDPVDIIREQSPHKMDLIHMAMGVSGEAGELLDCVKKYTMYDKPLDRENLKEELGDLLFYMVGMMLACDLTLEEVMARNMDKLGHRYASGSFSNQQAQERADKLGEE